MITSGDGDDHAGGHLLAQGRLEFGGAGELGDRLRGGLDLGSLIMDSAMMNSFQLRMKVRIAVVKTPGAASGSSIAFMPLATLRP